MMKKILLRFAIAVLLNSCGIYSRYTPVSEVPEGLYGSSDTVMAADTASLGNLSWQEMFTDLHLQELVGIGLQNNTDLQTARLKSKGGRGCPDVRSSGLYSYFCVVSGGDSQ